MESSVESEIMLFLVDHKINALLFWLFNFDSENQSYGR